MPDTNTLESAPTTADTSSNSHAKPIKRRLWELFEGAVGVGLVLVLLPCIALIVGMKYIHDHSMVGLPVLAIFGIIILFGALALTSTLFSRLGLSDKAKALALPEGSIRAAIAMALIVLFAIIAIMLYQSLAEPYKIPNLNKQAVDNITGDTRNRVMAIIKEPCFQDNNPVQCDADKQLFTVHLRQPQGQESTDLAKQLLILIGTLMTSVTSFYFATQSSAAATSAVLNRTVPPAGEQGTNSQENRNRTGTGSTIGSGTTGSTAAQGTTGTTGTNATTGSQEAVKDGTQQAAADGESACGHDGCDLNVQQPTTDEELPPARGGVA